MRTTLTFHGFLKIPDLFHIIFLATQVRQLATFCWINCKKGFPILRLERALRESLFRKFAADRKSEGGVIVSGSASSSELSRLYCSVEVFCNKRCFHWIKFIKTHWRILFPLNINDEKLRLLSEPPSSGGLEKKSLKTIFPPLCEDNDAPLPRWFLWQLCLMSHHQLWRRERGEGRTTSDQLLCGQKKQSIYTIC